MLEREVRHPKEDLCQYHVLVKRMSGIEGLPDGAAKPLAALVRSSGVETSAHLGEIRRTVRHSLGELLAILDQRGETSDDEATRARALLEAIPTGSNAVVRRIDIVVPAIAVLRACGCQLKEAAALTAQLYPVAGWGRVEPKTIIDTFYTGAPAELRGDPNEHHERIRAELVRIADELEIDGPAQPNLR